MSIASLFILFYFLSLNSGVCFLINLSTLAFRLSEVGFSAKTIGFIGLTTLPYSLKFFWAPFVETYSLAFSKDVRKSWGYASLLGISGSLLGLGCVPPENYLWITIFFSVFLGLSAATYDMVVDGLRLELITEKNMGLGASAESIGFRTGMMISGAGALYLAHYYGWTLAYGSMIVFSIISFFALLLLPKRSVSRPIQWANRLKTTLSLYKNPLKDLLSRPYITLLIPVILGFKCMDTVLNGISAPFLRELGFTKIEYADVTKVLGVGLMMLGGFVGALCIRRFGIIRTTYVSRLSQGGSSLLFLLQLMVGHDVSVLCLTIGVESFCSGLTGTVFIAYISSFCKRPFLTTEFTLLYSLGSFSRAVFSALSGWVATRWGWSILFLLTSLFTIPGIICIMRIERQKRTLIEDASEETFSPTRLFSQR